MKKLLLISLFVLFSISLYSQELKLTTAKEGFDYLKKTNILENYELAYVMGIQAGTGSEVDMMTGQSNFWIFLCKSKDTSDHLGHMYITMKMDSTWDYMYQTDEQADYQMLASIPNENWVNSSVIGEAISNNKEFVQFVEINSAHIQVKQFNLIYADNPIPGAGGQLMQWAAVAYVSQENMAICYYDGTKGTPLLCSIPPVVSIVSNKIKNLLYPNPTLGKVTLKNEINENSTVMVYDASGTIVIKLQDVVPSNLTLDLSNMNNGQYTVVILSKDKMTSQKVIMIK